MKMHAPVPFLTDRAQSLKNKLVPLNEISEKLESTFLVRGLLGEGSLSVLFGDSNCGKTFFALDIAMHVASGVSLRDSQVSSGPVVYIAAEGNSGLQNRIQAIKMAKPKLAKTDNFFLLPTQLNLHSGEDADALCQIMPKKKIALIVIDTLARSMGGGDENSARDMGAFIRNVDLIRERTGAHVMVIHHTGKGDSKSARGSSALRAAVDTELFVRNGCLECKKQRDIEVVSKIYFEIKSVKLGVDQFGGNVTSAIVVPRKPDEPALKKLTVSAEAALQVLRQISEQIGKEDDIEGLLVGQKVVDLARWKSVFDQEFFMNDPKPKDTRRKAFDRAKELLVTRGYIEIVSNKVLLKE